MSPATFFWTSYLPRNTRFYVPPAGLPAKLTTLLRGPPVRWHAGDPIHPLGDIPVQATTALPFFPQGIAIEIKVGPNPRSYREHDGIGFRRGAVGTHTSRTMMLAELTTLFDTVPATAASHEIGAAIKQANCLGKATTSTRRLTNQRLSELYSLDPAVSLYRVLRRLWAIDPAGRPLLAFLCAIARDPLLAASASAVIPLPIGNEFARSPMKDAIRAAVHDRLNESILDKVVRNAASSWTQGGHLVGRTIKKRASVVATPGVVAFALYLSQAAGFHGQQIFTSGWAKLLDADASALKLLALDAKRAGLIDLRIAGDVFDISFNRLDPATAASANGNNSV